MVAGGPTSLRASCLERQVLEIVRDLVSELNLESPPDDIGLVTLLEEDLAIYSLERVELILRLEKACGIHLRDGAAMDARQVGDIIRLLSGQIVQVLDTPASAGGHVPATETGAPTGSVAFTAYVALVLLVIGGAVWPLLHVLPRGPRAASLLRRAARTLLRTIGCPVEVTGLDHLAGALPAMLVANHQSYVDSVVLLAVLPILPNILVNERLPDAPLIRTGVRAARYLAVDRTSVQGRLTCADAMARVLRAGESLLVFPEGTFPSGPGLLPFRLGPFSAAAAAGRPVVPITLRGTRQMLPSGASLLRRSEISVTIHPAIHPSGAGWSDAVRLRQQAREQIATALDSGRS